MLYGKHITVIIPALNEEQSIARVINEIPAIVDGIIVVDNGSRDGTAQLASSVGAKVIYESRKGYGAACLAGMKAAGATDLLGFIDGDYSDYPQDLVRIIEPVARGEAELVVGCRIETDSSSPGLAVHQRLGNWLACCVIWLLHGIHYADIGPMRCISLDLLQRLGMSDSDYGWTTEMQLKASRLGVPVMQLPVRYRQRIGKSKISGTLKGSLMAGYKIFYWTFRLFALNRKASRSQ